MTPDPGDLSLPSSPGGSALHALALERGILLRHRDGFEEEVRPEADTLRAVLHAMGDEVRDEETARHRLGELRRERARVLLEPVQVLWEGAPPRIRVGEGLPEGSPLEVRLALESDGDVQVVEFGERVRDRGVPLPVIPGPGYHGIRIRRPGTSPVEHREAEGTLVVAPRRVYGAGAAMPPEWSAFLPLYALGSQRNRGVGDLTDLEHLLRWVEGLGGGSVATLPLMAAFLDAPLEPSPYAPVSRTFWNELYLDPTRVPEWEASPEARRLLESSRAQGLLAQLRQGDQVPYGEVWELQRLLLDHLSGVWAAGTLPGTVPSGESGDASFKRFLREYPDAPRYAAFRGTMDAGTGDWRSWPERWRRVGIPEGIPDAGAFRRHLYAQFRFVRQLEEVLPRSGDRAGLYLDLPLGAHPSGYDLWANPGLFADGIALGAPPDGFHEEGQSWGLPPILPQAARRDGYRHLRRILTRLLPHARILRIDHVMGLHRLYWVPDGETAVQGAYVGYPAEELHAILALESHRHRTILVGEDLGTVPPEVRAEMDRRGLRRMYVVPFEFSRDRPGHLRPVPPGSVAGVGTHDTPPFAALWREEGIRSGLRAFREGISPDPGEEDPLDVLRRILSWLGEGPAGVVVVNLEDLWLEERPQNRPGTTDQLNWSRRARFPLEAFTTMKSVESSLRMLTRARQVARPRSTPPDPSVAPSESVVFEERSPEVKDRTSVTVSPERQGVEAEPSASLFTEEDIYLFNEGSHLQLHHKLGAQLSKDPHRPGVNFAVWAPNAAEVSVVGDFNDWTPGRHPLELRGNSGIWEGFIVEAGLASVYKYHISSQVGGYTVQKADPFGFRHETPPATASVVWDLEYEWGDADWMERRGDEASARSPISVYEVHLASWRRDPSDPRRFRSYRELAVELAEYVKELGFTHVELLPIMEHPFYGSWGYQTTGYFAPSSRQGSPQDLMFLIDTLHQAGVGVILDWVPSHFPTDEHGLAFFDGTHLFEHSDPRQGFHPDWKSAIFNYGRNEVRSFLFSSALFWLDHYHVDGIRVDAVASMLYLDYSRQEGEWIPNRFGGRENLEAIDFLRRLNSEIYAAHPDVHTIAEESTSWPMVSRPTYVGGLGFGMKWDMGWMHDSLQYLSRDPIHRPFHHEELTFRGLYAFNENFMLPLSHDEVVHGKGSLLGRMPGNEWEKRANLRLLLGWQYLQPGKKLLFMGGEIGQWAEWNHEGGVDWHLLEDPGHRGIQRLVGDLNRLYRGDPSLHRADFEPDGFQWIDANDRQQSVVAFLRKDPLGEAPPVLAVFNFTPVPRENHRIGVPRGGRWAEVLNSDSHMYGGGGWGNLGGVDAVPIPFHGLSNSVVLTLPPLSVVVLRAAD